MDEFKKYLVENQEQFNADEPSSLFGSKVQEQLKTQSEKTSLRCMTNLYR
jgi:hypothetical protein